MDLIIADRSGATQAVVRSYDLDMGFGADENSFDLKVFEKQSYITAGCRIFIPGTEYGGIVTTIEPSRTASKGSSLSFSGTTWHGVLNDHVFAPDSGQTHWAVSGECNAVIGKCIDRLGVGAFFEASTADSGASCSGSFRFKAAYDAMRKMMSDAGRAIKFTWDETKRKCLLEAVEIQTYGDKPESIGTTAYTATLVKFPYNHIIGLGAGEGVDRAIVNLYYDGIGTYSDAQTIKGIDERTYVYDTGATKKDDLRATTLRKFKSLVEANEVTVELGGTSGMSIGDYVKIIDPTLGEDATVTAEINKLVVSIVNGKRVSITPSYLYADDTADDIEYD